MPAAEVAVEEVVVAAAAELTLTSGDVAGAVRRHHCCPGCSANDQPRRFLFAFFPGAPFAGHGVTDGSAWPGLFLCFFFPKEGASPDFGARSP